MDRILLLLFRILIVAILDVYRDASVFVDTKSFEYELPNRTVTICPTYSLISIECPQVTSSSSHGFWQPNVPQYLISIDYIRSYPAQSTHDPSSCQPDFAHACEDYDLRYLNTLCNGKPHCPDIPTYQIRDRSLCAFKAVTDIGYHCVPTWNMNQVRTKCDICKNGSLTNDYGFIYSRNYPEKAPRLSCFTTIYARPDHQTILYFVNGELNYDDLRIESVTAQGTTILNATLNGNLTTQRLAASTYELRITFTPSHIYSYHPTYYLLYFYTVPICSVMSPCPVPVSMMTTITTNTVPTFLTTNATRIRIQSIGWTRVSNIWIIIPVILAYIVLLILIIVLALFFQRHQKQQQKIDSIQNSEFAARYLDTSGATSNTQLATSYPSSPILPGSMSRTDGTFSRTYSNRHRADLPHSSPYPAVATHGFVENLERYHRDSQSDYNIHRNTQRSMDYRAYPPSHDVQRRGYGTVTYSTTQDDSGRPYRQRRALPKSFSDCDLCRRSIISEDYPSYLTEDEQTENWQWQKSLQSEESTRESRGYREKIKEQFRERLTVRQIADRDDLPTSTKIIDYHSIIPSHQRSTHTSGHLRSSQRQIPFQYIPNENRNSLNKNQYQGHSTGESLTMANHHQYLAENEHLRSILADQFYPSESSQIDGRRDFLDRPFHDTKEVQELSMRLHEHLPHSNRCQYPCGHQRHSLSNDTDY